MSELQVVIDEDFLYHLAESKRRTFIDGSFWARTPEELESMGKFDKDGYLQSYQGVFTGFDGNEAVVSIYRGTRWEQRGFDREIIEIIGAQERCQVTIHIGRKNGKIIAVADLTPHSEPTYREVPR